MQRGVTKPTKKEQLKNHCPRTTVIQTAGRRGLNPFYWRLYYTNVYVLDDVQFENKEDDGPMTVQHSCRLVKRLVKETGCRLFQLPNIDCKDIIAQNKCCNACF